MPPSDKPIAAAAPSWPIIESQPTGARIFIEGKEIGTTPRVLRNIGVPFDFTVRLDGYEDARGLVVRPDDKLLLKLVEIKNKRVPTKAAAPAASSQPKHGPSPAVQKSPAEETLD